MLKESSEYIDTQFALDPSDSSITIAVSTSRQLNRFHGQNISALLKDVQKTQTALFAKHTTGGSLLSASLGVGIYKVAQGDYLTGLLVIPAMLFGHAVNAGYFRQGLNRCISAKNQVMNKIDAIAIAEILKPQP